MPLHVTNNKKESAMNLCGKLSLWFGKVRVYLAWNIHW